MFATGHTLQVPEGLSSGWFLSIVTSETCASCNEPYLSRCFRLGVQTSKPRSVANHASDRRRGHFLLTLRCLVDRRPCIDATGCAGLCVKDFGREDGAGIDLTLNG